MYKTYDEISEYCDIESIFYKYELMEVSYEK